MPRPNWFFAFPVDGAFVAGLPEPPSELRLFHPEDVHLTLAWLGGCGEERARRALAALDVILSSASPRALDVSLDVVVPMGSPRRGYTALSALLKEGREEAAALMTALRDPLADAAGVSREKRTAKAHVTVARPRPRASDAAREAGLAWAEQLDLRGVRTRLDRVALYTWDENRRERLFRIYAERRLG